MLSEVQVRNAKPREMPFRLTDGGGLFLFVTPAGGKMWRLRYAFGGKEKTLSLGHYPAVSLLDARSARDAAKRTLSRGLDPAAEKKIERATAQITAETTFEPIAREWHKLQKPIWTERHATEVLESFETHVFPAIGARPITEITPPEVLLLLREIEARPAIETARRVRQRISAVFVYAIATGRGVNDPAAIVQKAMAPLIKKRQPAITDLDRARDMLLQAEAMPAHPVTKLAHRLLVLTVLRPGTLTTTPWEELDDAVPQGVWQVPAARMKLRQQHKSDEARDFLVPLSRQAIETIEAVRTVTGRGPLAFPMSRHAHKPLSENAIGYYLNRAGFHGKHVPHGWRSTFSSVMNERYPADRQIIDLMLAHVPPNKVEAAYNRALHLPRRAELAQIWADLILQGVPPAQSLLDGPRRRRVAA